MPTFQTKKLTTMPVAAAEELTGDSLLYGVVQEQSKAILLSELVEYFSPITLEQAVQAAPVQSVNGDIGAVTITPAGIGALSTSDRGATNGVAELIGGIIPSNRMPSIAVTQFLDEVADEAEMLALVGQYGDWCIRSDQGKVWVIVGADCSIISGWKALEYPASPVQSVNGQIGAVMLGPSDVGADAAGAAAQAQSAAIDTAVQRGNHTGTQTAATISDFAVAAAQAAPVQTVNGQSGSVTVVPNVEDWAGPGMVIAARQPVVYRGLQWVCITAHTTTASFDAAKFIPTGVPYLITNVAAPLDPNSLQLNNSTNCLAVGRAARINYGTQCVIVSTAGSLNTEAQILGVSTAAMTYCAIFGRGTIQAVDISGFGTYIGCQRSYIIGEGTLGAVDYSMASLGGTVHRQASVGYNWCAANGSTITTSDYSVILGGSGHSITGVSRSGIFAGQGHSVTGNNQVVVGGASCTANGSDAGGIYSSKSSTGYRLLFCNTVTNSAGSNAGILVANSSVTMASGASTPPVFFGCLNLAITSCGNINTIGNWSNNASALVFRCDGLTDGRIPDRSLTLLGEAQTLNGLRAATKKQHVVVQAVTTAAVTAALGCGGSATTFPQKVAVRVSGRLAVAVHEIEVIATAPGRVFSKKLRVVYKYDGTTYTRIAINVLDTIQDNNGGGELAVTVDNDNDNHLRVVATSTVSETVHWIAHIESVFNNA